MKKILLLLAIVALIMTLFVPVAFAGNGDTSGIIQAQLPDWAWVLIIIGAIVIIIVVMFFLLPRFLALAQKKGWDVQGFIDKTSDAIEKVDSTVETLIKLGAPLGLVDTILDYAATGVNYAEQLYHDGRISAEERKPKAEDAIMALLKGLGVPEDKLCSGDIQKLISIGMEAAVNGLGHDEASRKDGVQG